jgi:hypothetical protein
VTSPLAVGNDEFSGENVMVTLFAGSPSMVSVPLTGTVFSPELPGHPASPTAKMAPATATRNGTDRTIAPPHVEDIQSSSKWCRQSALVTNCYEI